MTKNMQTERPETDTLDKIRFPALDEVNFAAMEAEYKKNSSVLRIWGFVRKNSRQEPFVDLYVWDRTQEPSGFVRFVICEGCGLSKKEEKKFREFTRNPDLQIDIWIWLNMHMNARNLFPQWKIPFCLPEQIGEDLEHMYFASYRSGAREILYKAELNRIAYNLDRIPGHNPFGSTPTDIVGHHLPIKLLRILNGPHLIQMLYREKTIEECAAVYRQYASYLGMEPPVSRLQWEYLTELYRNGGELWGAPFNRCLYWEFEKKEDQFWFQCCEKFFELNRKAGDIYKGKIPRLSKISAAILRLEEYLWLNEKETGLDLLIQNRRECEPDWEFRGETYMVCLPESYREFREEAVHQGNCLMEYVENHAAGQTTILFIRKTAEPRKSFVTMEVNDQGEITQLYARNNRLAERSVYEFVETYASKLGLRYDPSFLVWMPFHELTDVNNEIGEYIQDFLERTGIDGFWSLEDTADVPAPGNLLYMGEKI